MWFTSKLKPRVELESDTEIFTHPERFIHTPEELAKKDSFYLPTHDYGRTYINGQHESYTQAPVGRMGVACAVDLGIDGYLQHGDILKLYELAYFSQGDVLELGTYMGLSASVIARALHDAGRRGRLVTVDVEAKTTKAARKTLAGMKGADLIAFNVMDADVFMDQLIAKRQSFSFVFIDHWHSYDATRAAIARLPQLLTMGGFALFHDYNDPDNAKPEHVHKVYQAIRDTLAQDKTWRFCMVCGACALFQKIG